MAHKSSSIESKKNPTYSHRNLKMGLIAGAQLMVVLDITIVNIALPSIAHGLSISSTTLAWVVDAYTLVFGGLLLLGGRSGDIFGRRKMFVVGILIFAAASFMGGLATSEATLIAARAIQGIGGAIASPNALALITTNFPEGRDRNEALGIAASVSALGASMGLIFGAILTQYLSWRWVFFVNTPIAIVIAVLAPKFLKESSRNKIPSDLLGSVTSVAMIGSLVYGLIHSASSGWTSTISVVAFAGAVIFGTIFIFREKSHKAPLVDFMVFSNRNRSGAYAVMFLVAAALFSLWFFLTQYLQIVLGYSALKAGFAFLPMTLTVMVLAKVGSKYVKRIGPTLYLIYGPSAIAVALFIFGHLGPHSSYLTFVLPALLLNGTGLAATFAAVLITALSAVTPKHAGLASAMVSVSQQVGGTLGISVLITVATGLIHASTHLANGTAIPSTKALTVLAEMHAWTGGFKVGAIIAGTAALVGALTIRRPNTTNLVPIIADAS